MTRIRTAFVAAFFALSILPVLQSATGFVDVAPLPERRRPAPPPDFAAALHGDGRLSAAINAWFDDRNGFRPLFVRLKNQLDYWLFRHSDKIFIGTDGWLYLPGFFDSAVSVERAGDAGAERLHQRFLEIARYLAAAGIRLVVISNPDKETTYPQNLPGNVPILPKYGRDLRLRDWLESRREFDYIDGAKVLARCRPWRTFNFQDIHMTLPGGVCFAQTLVALIAKQEGRLASPWDHTFDYTEQYITAGGQADFMALLMPIARPAYAPNHTYENEHEHDAALSTDPAGVFEWIYRAAPGPGAQLLPPVVLFGDSFIDHYRAAGIQAYFSATYRARNDDTNLAKVLTGLPADTRYFVFEYLEPWSMSTATYRVPAPDAARSGNRRPD
jgi:hypothetical protein